MIKTSNAREWIKLNYPKLKINENDKKLILSGDFDFFAAFNEEQKIYTQNPTHHICNDKSVICLQDSFKIKIVVDKLNNIPLELYEINNRITNISKKLGINLNDLHIYESGKCCYVGLLDEDISFSIEDFLKGPVLQFFYDQSFFELYGSWPRGEFLHSLLGVVENFYDHFKRNKIDSGQKCIDIIYNENGGNYMKEILIYYLENKRKVQGHINCLCGSGKIFRTCHENLYHGIWNLQDLVEKKKYFLPTK